MRMRRRVPAIGVAAVLVAGAAAGLLARQASPTAKPAAPATKTAGAAKPSTTPPILPAKFTTPPLVTTGYAGARPAGITRAVYDFAAQHPEVLKYVPCYCGCEADGHPHNESCFVKTRDGKGNVTQWDMHGYG
jgi:Protein of unknown function with PCYCGC motif